MTETDTERAQARTRLKQLSAQYVQDGDPTGWFEVLYRAAAGDTEGIPWAHLTPNPLLIEWLERHRTSGDGRNALVVGCGLGDDAEALAHHGFTVTAFDISPEAIAWCRQRFPSSPVRYVVADALDLPSDWDARFDFIMEAYTLQSLPEEALREQVAANLVRCVSPGGDLLVICGGREQHEERGTMPWPLTRAELAMFPQQGLREVSFEDLVDHDKLAFRHFRARFRG